MRKFLLLCLFILFLYPATAVYAGAWVQEKGKGLNIFTFSHYASTQYWTSGGELTGAPLYTKYELDDYLEYGLTERLTLGLDLSAIQSHTGSTGIQRGDYDNLILGRYLIWKNDRSVFSVQFFADYIGHGAQFNVPPNSHLNTGEALLVGSSGTFGQNNSKNWFADASFGLVQRYSGGNQFQLVLEGGLKFDEDRLWLFLQSFNTLSLNHPGYPQNINYNLATLAPSIIYWFFPAIGGQLGVAQDIYGQNVGKGTSPFIAVWYRF